MADDAAAAAAAAAAAPAADGEVVGLRAVFAETTYDVSIGLDQTVAELKAAIEAACGCPAGSQKLMYKGACTRKNKETKMKPNKLKKMKRK